MKKTLFVSLIILIVTILLAAQINFKVSATILPKLSLTKISDLNFGSLISPDAGGTVQINVSTGERILNNIQAVGTDFSRAEIEISGIVGATVGVSLSTESNGNVVQLINTQGAGQLTAQLTTNVSNGTLTIGPDGKVKLYVGGELTIPANANAGVYQSSDIVVTANYQ